VASFQNRSHPPTPNHHFHFISRATVNRTFVVDGLLSP
jgi:hypothetical protein